MDGYVCVLLSCMHTMLSNVWDFEENTPQPASNVTTSFECNALLLLYIEGLRDTVSRAMRGFQALRLCCFELKPRVKAKLKPIARRPWPKRRYVCIAEFDPKKIQQTNGADLAWPNVAWQDTSQQVAPILASTNARAVARKTHAQSGLMFQACAKNTQNQAVKRGQRWRIDWQIFKKLSAGDDLSWGCNDENHDSSSLIEYLDVRPHLISGH